MSGPAQYRASLRNSTFKLPHAHDVSERLRVAVTFSQVESCGLQRRTTAAGDRDRNMTRTSRLKQMYWWRATANWHIHQWPQMRFRVHGNQTVIYICARYTGCELAQDTLSLK
jgi:hypothetical protein